MIGRQNAEHSHQKKYRIKQMCFFTNNQQTPFLLSQTEMEQEHHDVLVPEVQPPRESFLKPTHIPLNGSLLDPVQMGLYGAEHITQQQIDHTEMLDAVTRQKLKRRQKREEDKVYNPEKVAAIKKQNREQQRVRREIDRLYNPEKIMAIKKQERERQRIRRATDRLNNPEKVEAVRQQQRAGQQKRREYDRIHNPEKVIASKELHRERKRLKRLNILHYCMIFFPHHYTYIQFLIYLI